jgi:hypothetical protein
MNATRNRGWWYTVRATLLLAIASCSVSSTERFWQRGDVYDLTMRVTQRSPSLQAARDSGRLRDMIQVSLRVDSIAADSVFGSYQADWQPLGMWIGNTPPTPQRFAGRLTANELSITLSPAVIDASARLHGTLVDGSGHGTWEVDGAAAEGDFDLRRR